MSEKDTATTTASLDSATMSTHGLSSCYKCKKMYLDRFYCISIIFTLFFLLHTVTTEEVPGLYKPTDPIVDLNNDTWKSELMGHNKVWIVEFYSSWCGHCQAFAPKWVKLAVQLQNWNKYTAVGALNCANPRNRDTCTTFNIAMYPTIKYFDVHWENKTEQLDEDGNTVMGFTFKGSRTLSHLRHKLIDIVENQTHPDYDKSGIPFEYLRLEGVPAYMKAKKDQGFKYMALVFDEMEDSYVGKTIIMDTSKSKHLVCRRGAKDDTSLLKKYEVSEFPALVLVKLHSGEFEHLSNTNRTYLGFVQALQKVLNSVAKAPTDVVNIEEKEKKKKEAVETVPRPALKKSIIPIDQQQEIHMVDLTSAVSFALRREVPKTSVVKGEALEALKGFVQLLLQCFPAEKSFLTFLRNLDGWLAGHSDGGKIVSADYINFIEHNSKSTTYLPQDIEWRGCKGSEPKFRGFPCSLWTLFHTMTVDCSSKYSKTTLTGLGVLTRVRGFIDHFFGCRYCRDHFMEMAKNLESEVSTHDSAIMWLWERHNRVNARLRNHVSADPQFPKIQFPPPHMCPECRNAEKAEYTMVVDPGHGIGSITWNKMAVMGFLKEHFGTDNIRVDGDPDPHKPKLSYKFFPRSRPPPATLSFIGLTRIDMSLCVVLYVSVIGTLIGLYIYFIKRKKKKQWKNIVLI